MENQNLNSYRIFDQLEIGVQIIDPNFCYLYLNKSLLKSVGKSLKDHLGKKMELVYPSINQTEIFHSIKNCMLTGEKSLIENEFEFEDGRITHWELRLERIEEGVIIFSHDVTNSKEGERLILESNRRIKTILGFAAHDLRSPLGNVLNVAQLLEQTNNTNEKLVNLLLSSSKKALEMVKNILEYAALGTGKINLSSKPTHIYSLLSQNIENHKQHKAYKNQYFTLNICQNFMAKIDPLRFEQIFENLISNAIKYSPDESTIAISLTPCGNFSITNRIDNSKIYRRNSNPQDQPDHVGFGMEIIRYLLELHTIFLKVAEVNEEFTASFNMERLQIKK